MPKSQLDIVSEKEGIRRIVSTENLVKSDLKHSN